MTKYVYIYALTCPETGIIRYVGKTIDLAARYKKHLYKNVKTRCRNWIESLKARGLKPQLRILIKTDEAFANFWETRVIKRFKETGIPLTNLTDGGEGGDTLSAHPNKEDIARRSALHRKGLMVGEKNPMYGKKHSEEHKKHLSKKIQGMYDSGAITLPAKTPEQRRAIGERLKKHNYLSTPEGRKKDSENNSLAKNPNASIYEFTDPCGVKYTVIGSLKKFCKEHKLRRTSVMLYLKDGRRNLHGWVCIKRGKNRLLRRGGNHENR